MPPTVLPTPVGKWKKWLLDAAKNIAVGLIQTLDYYEQINLVTEQPPAQWRRVQLLFQDTADPDTANIMATTFDIVNITNGAVDNTWTDADYDFLETEFGAMMSGYGPYMATRMKWFQSRYYIMQFNPLPDPTLPLRDDKPFAPSGTPERVFAHNFVGSGGLGLPPQCAITTTEKTNFPHHWGRNYWPAPAASTVNTDGRITSTATAAVSSAIGNAYDALSASEFHPVVAVTQSLKQPARALLSVNEIQCDNVFDVQRRRRTHTASLRSRFPL